MWVKDADTEDPMVDMTDELRECASTNIDKEKKFGYHSIANWILFSYRFVNHSPQAPNLRDNDIFNSDYKQPKNPGNKRNNPRNK